MSINTAIYSETIEMCHRYNQDACKDKYLNTLLSSGFSNSQAAIITDHTVGMKI